MASREQVETVEVSPAPGSPSWRRGVALLVHPHFRSGWLVRSVLAVLGGLALAVAFPPYDQTWLMPLGLAALMLTMPAQRGRAGFGYGLLFGLAFMLVLMWWNTIVGYDAWFALALLEALFYALMGMAWAWMRAYRWWPLGFALAWVGAELLRSTVPFGGLPWGRLAFGLADVPFDRYGRLGGTALVSFLAVLVIAVVVSVATRRDWSWRGAVTVLAAVAVVALSVLVPVGAAGAGRQVTVATVQGNVPGSGLDPFAERRAVLHNHANTTQAFAARVARGDAPQPDVVIWPENSTDIDPFRNESAYEEIDNAVKAIGVPTLVGAVVNGPDAQHVENMGIVWSPTTGPGEEYTKRHPVPFGEYIPFRSVLTKYISRLKQIPRDFYAGKKVGVMQLGPVQIGDLICFEVAYDGLVRDIVNGGGKLVVVQTNNATWAVSKPGQLDQQFAISRYRAIETGRTVVVAATDGISAIVAPNGTVLDRAEPKTRKVLEEQVPLASGITGGVRVGGWLDLGLSIVAALLTIGAYLGVRRRTGKMET
ncbi:MAG: apolipoprotein N-acyltransferase [Nocardioidaceae bacterium]